MTIHPATMQPRMATRVVHLELHTGDLPQAFAFYAQLLGCGFENVNVNGGSYLAMDFGGGVGAGIVECGTSNPSWLPYVEVSEIRSATARARELGAGVLLDAREGPAGWRSVITEPAGGELGLWQPKPVT
jgi:predicted enzyme related to lactoylglutathione lyase